MRLAKSRFWIPVLVLLAGSTVVVARSPGPPVRSTGAPPVGNISSELTCSQAFCHSGNVLNQNGMLEVIGVPDVYTPGTTYPLTVRLTSTATQGNVNRRWGFQLMTARFSDGHGSGTFDIPLDLLELGANFRTYVSHSLASLHGAEASPVEWSFSWNAPAQDEGPVGFYLAGNAANGDLLQTGDFIYTASDTAMSEMTPVVPTTWGGLKILYSLVR